MRSAVLAFFVSSLALFGWASLAERSSAGNLEAVVGSRDLSQLGETELMGRLADLEEYLRENPEDPQGLFLQGYLLGRLGRSAEAKGPLGKLVGSGNAGPGAYNNLGLAFADEGDYDKAAEVLKAGLRSEPSYRVIFDNLNLVLGRLASQAYSRALGDDWSSEPEPSLVWLAWPPAGKALETSSVSASSAVRESGGTGPRLATNPAMEIARGNGPEGQLIEQPIPPSATTEVQASNEPTTRSEALDPEVAVVDAAEVSRRVLEWAEAWSNQDPDRYLSFYSSSFVPPDGLSRREWEALRRARLMAPRFIAVSLAIQDVEVVGSGDAVVRFIQSYRSDVFSDTVTKTLRLTPESGWKISREFVD